MRAPNRARTPARRGSGVLAIAALVLVACFVPAGEAPGVPSPQGGDQELRVHGEFGLAVHLEDDSVRVRWMTREPAPGFLEVSVDGEVLHEATTRTWPSHAVTFPAPESDRFLLRYGTEGDPLDRHETGIHLGMDDRRGPARVTGVDSLYVLGDIHGEYDNMIRVLRNAGLIDDDLRWSGGRSHLVTLGDMMSRGMDVAAVLWFLYRLEREAEEAGGRLHVVLGNHEIMVMLDDLRYVHYKEAWIAESYQVGYDRLYDPRRSVLGRWLASKPAMLQVEDVLMAHGGVSDAYLDYTPESHRDSLATFMGEDLFYHWADPSVRIEMDEEAFQRRIDFFWDEKSVFWHRDYARSDEFGEELAAVLERYDAEVHVVAHTPVPGIREAYGGALIMTNTFPFAEELLLLTPTDNGWERLRFGQAGPPMALEVGHPEVPAPAEPDTMGVGHSHPH